VTSCSVLCGRDNAVVLVVDHSCNFRFEWKRTWHSVTPAILAACCLTDLPLSGTPVLLLDDCFDNVAVGVFWLLLSSSSLWYENLLIFIFRALTRYLPYGMHSVWSCRLEALLLYYGWTVLLSFDIVRHESRLAFVGAKCKLSCIIVWDIIVTCWLSVALLTTIVIDLLYWLQTSLLLHAICMLSCCFCVASDDLQSLSSFIVDCLCHWKASHYSWMNYCWLCRAHTIVLLLCFPCCHDWNWDWTHYGHYYYCIMMNIIFVCRLLYWLLTSSHSCNPNVYHVRKKKVVVPSGTCCWWRYWSTVTSRPCWL
jgi:hypothetical protein